MPLTALLRQDDGWSLFVASSGRAELRTVELGNRNGTVAEIRQGLTGGERVVVHPSNRVVDGVRIAARG